METSHTTDKAAQSGSREAKPSKGNLKITVGQEKPETVTLRTGDFIKLSSDHDDLFVSRLGQAGLSIEVYAGDVITIEALEDPRISAMVDRLCRINNILGMCSGNQTRPTFGQLNEMLALSDISKGV